MAEDRMLPTCHPLNKELHGAQTKTRSKWVRQWGSLAPGAGEEGRP